MNPFKKLFSSIDAPIDAILQTPEDMNLLVQEIHDSFNAEGNRLLNEAKAFLSEANISTEEESMVHKLMTAGFGSHPLISKLSEKRMNIKMKTELATLVDHFNFQYPQNRFITKEGVDNLCKKYNLLCGPVENYIGDVPLNNLDQILNFKVLPEDNKYMKSGVSWSGREFLIEISYKEFQEVHKIQAIYNDPIKNDMDGEYSGLNLNKGGVLNSLLAMNRLSYSSQRRYFKDTSLDICAPEKDFNKTGMEISGTQLIKKVIPDPVVLHPVRGGYLIVTAWGIEAKDAAVQSPRSN